MDLFVVFQLLNRPYSRKSASVTARGEVRTYAVLVLDPFRLCSPSDRCDRVMPHQDGLDLSGGIAFALMTNCRRFLGRCGFSQIAFLIGRP